MLKVSIYAFVDFHTKVFQTPPGGPLRGEQESAVASGVTGATIKGSKMINSFDGAHPGTIPVAVLDSIQKSAYFTVLAVRMSTHNLPGIRLADTFLLALVILPEVLLWEIVGIAVESSTLARWFTLPTTEQIPSVALAGFHTGFCTIMMSFRVTTGSWTSTDSPSIEAICRTWLAVKRTQHY